MLSPHDALELIRSQLRAEVLPRLDPAVDNYAHSVVVAAIGALREIGQQVVDSDQWCEPSVTALRAAARAWPARFTADPECANRITRLVDAAAAADGPAAARSLLLDAAETAIEALWASPRGAEEEALLREIRMLLAADTQRELERSEKQS